MDKDKITVLEQNLGCFLMLFMFYVAFLLLHLVWMDCQPPIHENPPIPIVNQ